MSGDPGQAVSAFGELAGRVMAGDRAAADQLVRDYTEPLIETAVARWGLSSHTAQDMAQDALLAVIHKLTGGTLRPEEVPHQTGWAIGFLGNVVRNYIRSRDRRPAVSLDRGAVALPDRSARRPISLLDDQERERLAEALRAYAREEVERTTGRTREVLDLFLTGMRSVDIAHRLGMEPQRCYRILEREKVRVLAAAQARALGGTPKRPPLDRTTLAETLSKLPKHQRAIARLRCFEGMSPDDIARAGGYPPEVVEANLTETWKVLARRYGLEFPEALERIEGAQP